MLKAAKSHRKCVDLINSRDAHKATTINFRLLSFFPPYCRRTVLSTETIDKFKQQFGQSRCHALTVFFFLFFEFYVMWSGAWLNRTESSQAHNFFMYINTYINELLQCIVQSNVTCITFVYPSQACGNFIGTMRQPTCLRPKSNADEMLFWHQCACSCECGLSWPQQQCHVSFIPS